MSIILNNIQISVPITVIPSYSPTPIPPSGSAVDITDPNIHKLTTYENGNLYIDSVIYTLPSPRATTIYSSDDYGTTATALSTIELQHFFGDISCSLNGQYVLAIDGDSGGGSYTGYAYTSNDYGATWKKQPPSGRGNGAAVSNSGQYQTICFDGGSVWYSHDYGATWTDAGYSGAWTGAVMSADGQIQYLSQYNSGIWQSTDYGVTWTRIYTSILASEDNAIEIGCSDDGKYVCCSCGFSQDEWYVSNDTGASFTRYSDGKEHGQASVSTSGQYMVINHNGGVGNYGFKFSQDYGVTWNHYELSKNPSCMRFDPEENFLYVSYYATNELYRYKLSDFS